MGGQQYTEEKSGLPEINMSEIKKVLAHIEMDMRRFDMKEWGVTKEYVENRLLKITQGDIEEDYTGNLLRYMARLRKMNENGWAECNVRACFAGWQVLLSTPREEWFERFSGGELIGVRDKALKAFGFTDDEGWRVFTPPSPGETPESQLAFLKNTINQVLKERGMTERV